MDKRIVLTMLLIALVLVACSGTVYRGQYIKVNAPDTFTYAGDYLGKPSLVMVLNEGAWAVLFENPNDHLSSGCYVAITRPDADNHITGYIQKIGDNCPTNQ